MGGVSLSRMGWRWRRGVPWKIGILGPEEGEMESGKTETWMLGIGGPGEDGGGAHGCALPHDELGRHPAGLTFPPLPVSTGTTP